MPKKLTKEQMRKYQRDRRLRLKDAKPACKAVVNPVKPDVKPDVIVKPIVKPLPPGVKPLGLPLSPTGSTCNSFETLPKDVRADIDRLSPAEGEGAGPPGVTRADRIANAIHYQQYVRAG